MEIKLEDLVQSADPAQLIERLSFEEGLKLLEELVGGIERGSLSLEKSLVSYEKGVALVDHLRGMLSRAEEKLRVLKKDKTGQFQMDDQ